MHAVCPEDEQAKLQENYSHPQKPDAAVVPHLPCTKSTEQSLGIAIPFERSSNPQN